MRAVLPLTEPDGITNATFACVVSGSRRGHHAGDEEDESSPEDENESAPYNPYGMVFFRRIKTGVAVPRMRVGGPSISLSSFKYFFGTSIEEIKLKYEKFGVISKEVVATTRQITNKKKHTPTYANLSGQPQPTLFDLASKGYALPPPAVDDGSDVDMDEVNQDFQENAGHVDAEVTQMWRQFLVDLTMKMPNPRGSVKASYFKVPVGERLDANEDIFNNTLLSELWTTCQYKVVGKEEWTLAFKHLFPPPGHVTSTSVQNYTQCKYYMTWKKICANSPTADGIRHQIWKRFWTLAWIPHACQDRMWPSSKIMPGWTILPSDSQGPAPRILVRRTPQWE
jgi:hypothetical protein